MDFPTPFSDNWPPCIPRPCTVPHTMLHDDGRVVAATFGAVNDAFDAVLDAVFAGIVFVVDTITEQRARFTLIGVACQRQANIAAEELLKSPKDLIEREATDGYQRNFCQLTDETHENQPF